MIALTFALAAATAPSWITALEPIARGPAWQKASETYGDCLARAVEQYHGQGAAEIIAGKAETTCQPDRATLRQVTVDGLRANLPADAHSSPEIVADLMLQYIDASTRELAGAAGGQPVPPQK